MAQNPQDSEDDKSRDLNTPFTSKKSFHILLTYLLTYFVKDSIGDEWRVMYVCR